MNLGDIGARDNSRGINAHDGNQPQDQPCESRQRSGQSDWQPRSVFICLGQHAVRDACPAAPGHNRKIDQSFEAETPKARRRRLSPDRLRMKSRMIFYIEGKQNHSSCLGSRRRSVRENDSASIDLTDPGPFSGHSKCIGFSGNCFFVLNTGHAWIPMPSLTMLNECDNQALKLQGSPKGSKQVMVCHAESTCWSPTHPEPHHRPSSNR